MTEGIRSFYTDQATGETRLVSSSAGRQHTTPVRDDPLDTTAELTARVDALWDEIRAVKDEHSELVRIPLTKGALRTALIRAQRDAARRALNSCAALIEEVRRA